MSLTWVAIRGDLPEREERAMIVTAEDFGRQVAEARRALGLTQRDLALAIGTGERFIVELEAGKATAQLGKALTAARAVGLRLENTAGGR
jgi:HTH-type transcriptional regulator / antitoxin HipB